tara:strand:- start:2177 stop:2944 length:768 start_codon:yes stop_codon:yes gene_type:complete
MNNYLKLVNKLSRRNSKLYNLKTESISQVIFCRISYLITPIFIYLKISPNIITFLNFIISIFSVILIFLGDVTFFNYGIFLYFLYRTIDFCDGGVARHKNISTFYGRFIDAVADIFFNSFVLFSLSFFAYEYFDSKILLIVGIIASILTSYDSFIYDKYSSLARWSNSQNKKKILPYIKKTFLPKISFMYNDIITVTILLLPFLILSSKLFYFAFFLVFIVFILSAIQTFFIHLYFGYTYLNLNASDKNSKKKAK